MKAAIVTIGDEILIGQIVDTNSAFIAKKLDSIGIEVSQLLSIADNREQILETFAALQDRVDLVIITGGLGPTKDDITKKTFCDYFEDTLVMNEQVLAHVTNLIENFYKRPISQINKEQALVPTKCTVLKNDFGTAPGIWMKKNKTVFISLPGVPYEMKGIVEAEILPKIVAEYQRPYILHKTILTVGEGESRVAERIEAWEDALPPMIRLAYLPSPGRVRLRLSGRATDREALQKSIDDQVKSLTEIIGDIIVGFEDEDSLEVSLAKLLTEKQSTIATAESCTGGKIGQMLSSVPGASAYFRGSIVAYSTDVKTDILGVTSQVIKTHSVVSAKVAEEMARNARLLMKSDYAIATTGNAGPSKGDSDAEVGVVFIAIATSDTVFSAEFNFGQPREKVIDRAVMKSLELVRKEILKKSV
ncbi:MAG: competence/damage-inducible protein A [Flavobacterium sp.]|nr:competence/damage-inducible protein A [Flavobacterium sp.]